MKVLLLEDDMILSELVEEFLEEEGYQVSKAYDGEEALQLIEKEHFDLMLLDVGVPCLDGFAFLEYLRDMEIQTPVIFITSLSSARDVEKAFSLGCDDYLKKPFELKELKVRIEHVKRIYGLNRTLDDLGEGYRYDYADKAILHDETKTAIAQKEAKILEYMIRHKNRVISIEEITANIWQFEEAPSYATIRTYIKNLRKHLPHERIVTLKGIGYKLEI
ncbi:MAG TPA: response regulator transcription factor [Campylobacteraceae bacterium]|nr:response regulator transcription factor [Campylobacteraceae bacterium]